MKKKYLITKLVIILILSLVISCQNKNAELEKKIEKLEKENAEIGERHGDSLCALFRLPEKGFECKHAIIS